MTSFTWLRGIEPGASIINRFLEPGQQIQLRATRRNRLPIAALQPKPIEARLHSSTINRDYDIRGVVRSFGFGRIQLVVLTLIKARVP